MKIGEVLNEITSTQHRLAVLASVVEYLETFLPNDTEAPETFYVDGPCLIPEVPVDIVEEVLDQIVKIQGEQEKRLENLNKMETKDVKPKRPRRSTRKSSTK
tara:strand:+ start:1154 stop:1459 length:306 start_codon:yes stop_codon:yes gene_type:complete